MAVFSGYLFSASVPGYSYSVYTTVECIVYLFVISPLYFSEAPFSRIIVSILLIAFSELMFRINQHFANVVCTSSDPIYIFYKEAFAIMMLPYLISCLLGNSDHVVIISLLVSFTFSVLHYLKTLTYVSQANYSRTHPVIYNL
jgi:hypothetical protein